MQSAMTAQTRWSSPQWTHLPGRVSIGWVSFRFGLAGRFGARLAAVRAEGGCFRSGKTAPDGMRVAPRGRCRATEGSAEWGTQADRAIRGGEGTRLLTLKGRRAEKSLP